MDDATSFAIATGADPNLLWKGIGDVCFLRIDSEARSLLTLGKGGPPDYILAPYGRTTRGKELPRRCRGIQRFMFPRAGDYFDLVVLGVLPMGIDGFEWVSGDRIRGGDGEGKAACFFPIKEEEFVIKEEFVTIKEGFFPPFVINHPKAPWDSLDEAMKTQVRNEACLKANEALRRAGYHQYHTHNRASRIGLGISGRI
ncbi:uncharacterized protein LOC131005987 isoform X2 [Salvia miltiorrhiza]|uniref:uncharacterized protein LOC131005987 isoform X2 n=1 Tax=Salvia miltiorrhiza TaxID=226208 RepID=UPI0025AD0580|nr:uncharacterized protein LOC131005987 isoform X2 [Salvia miltiorrhiza]